MRPGAKTIEDEAVAIRSDYLRALTGAVPQVLDWWDALVARCGDEATTVRWPCGPASHPRIVGVFRHYYALAFELCEAREPASRPTVMLDFRNDDAWGDRVDEDHDRDYDLEASPIPPMVLLVEDLAEHPELHQFVTSMTMNPFAAFAPTPPTIEELGAERPTRPRAFEFITGHACEVGLVRLLHGPRDLRQPGELQGRGAEPSWLHRQAHHAYRRELDAALAEAERWWAGLLGAGEDRGATPDEAMIAAYQATIAGPAAHGRVLGVVQTYWAHCAALNERVPADQRVAPELFLLDWLRDGQHDSWVNVLCGLPYWPVGLTADGRWF